MVIKRDGQKQPFTLTKIEQAVTKAYRATGENLTETMLAQITQALVEKIEVQELDVETIQDLVEKQLMHTNPEVAKRYILYREQRTAERKKRAKEKFILDGIVAVEKNDINNENANMSAHTPAGQMMTFASETTKDYTHHYLLAPKYSQAHRGGAIHIHDLDYYPSKTTTCLQYDLADLFERGFKTKNGSIRTPQSIHSYATLATIIFQTNQNEQHGGQSIPAFDFFMAPGVLKTFQKLVANRLHFWAQLHDYQDDEQQLYTSVKLHLPTIAPTPEMLANLQTEIEKTCQLTISSHDLSRIYTSSFEQTRKETFQAMEGFIHNLNTMHSRGGNQVVFSSINYGTDTSAEGRLVIEQIMAATREGLGKGEIPVFPIQIFKVKTGVNYSEQDYQLAMTDFPAALNGEFAFENPNFDLFLQAAETTATCLFPNFMFLDQPFNYHEKWEATDPERWRYETATMGCRTRVFENLHGEKTSVGRGNASFTTMNLPRLAIEAKLRAELEHPEATAEQIQQQAKYYFLVSVEQETNFITEQLRSRFLYQQTALAKQFPFMMSNDLWKGGSTVAANDEVKDVLLSATLGVGFIGGHNAMVAIYGEGHGKNQAAYETLMAAVKVMNDVVQMKKAQYKLNYSVLATPAEGLSGRFTRLDREKYGEIAGVNDRDYYVNSYHIDVRETISSFDKIKKEAPFHALTLGGHITYVELDGEAKKNIAAIVKIVKTMNDSGVGYGSINHPVDTCQTCDYHGIIYTTCPMCGGDSITRMRRITGYLTGDLDAWNSAKKAEEQDRVKHR
ncbi:MAG: anaerobic ribonucleoside triphosphate reductase [Culicoidibacterales bacterium]